MSVSVPARGRRHSIVAVNRARELSNSGWGLTRTVELLAEEGIVVSRSTVFRWVSPKAERDAARRDRQRRARLSMSNGAGPIGHPLVTPEYKLARMRALRALGLNVSQVARLMSHDFGDPLTRHTVTRALQTGQYPRSLR